MAAPNVTAADRFGSAEWHRRVWRIAGPIMLSNVSTPLIGIVDTAVVGHLDHAYYIGAVAIGTMIFSFLFWGFGFLRMGTTGLTAQARGAGDRAMLQATLLRALLLAVVFGVALMLLRGPLAWVSFSLIDASADVERHAGDYFRIRMWGAPAALANYVLMGWLLGIGRSGLVFALQLVLNGVNVVLDLVFVMGFGWGVPGVAAASLIAEITALAVGIAVVLVIARGMKGHWRLAMLGDLEAFRRLLAVNRDIFIRTLCLVGGFAYFQVKAAELGDLLLAANAVLLNLFLFLSYALDGYAFAAEALTGERAGAGDNRGFRQAVRATSVWALATSVLFTLAYFAVGTLLIDTLTDIEAVRQTARIYLPWAAMLPIVSVWCFQFDGIYVGATWSAAMRNTMLVSLLIYLAAAWIAVPLFGNHGLWLALAIFMTARGVTMAIAYPALARTV